MKDKIPEVYVIEYPCNGKSYRDAMQGICIMQKQLDEVKSDVTPDGFRKMTGIKHDHRIFTVVGAKIDKIVTKLVYPHEAVMPDSFLLDILDQSLYTESLDEDKIHDFDIAMRILAHQGWNPSIAFSGRITCMYFEVRPGDIAICSPATSLLVYFNEAMLREYDEYKTKYNKPEYCTSLYEIYITWKKEYLKKNPEMSFEHWRNSLKLEGESQNANGTFK